MKAKEAVTSIKELVDPDIIGIRKKPFNTSVAPMKGGEESHD